MILDDRAAQALRALEDAAVALLSAIPLRADDAASAVVRSEGAGFVVSVTLGADRFAPLTSVIAMNAAGSQVEMFRFDAAAPKTFDISPETRS